MTTDLRARLGAIALDPADASQANYDFLYALLEVAEAAKGLSMGEDWNNGTQAKTHGYRQKLLDAVAKLEATK